MGNVKNLHANHRNRVRQRFIREQSFENFEEHQVLELLLFYSIPRRDTNELAHKMLNEYGSLYNLMNSSPQNIMKRCNVSEVTAVSISIIPSLTRKFLSSGIANDAPIINSIERTHKHFEALMLGQPFESFYMICLDLNYRVTRKAKISDGTNRKTAVHMDKLIENALMYNTSFVIVGHNHPAGNKNPSSSDLDATMQIKNALQYINVRLLDHIIICGSGFYSFASSNSCGLSYTLSEL